MIDLAVDLKGLVYLKQVGRLPNERDGGIHLMTAQLGILVPGRIVIIYTVSHVAIGETDVDVEQRIVGLGGCDVVFIVEIHRW